MVNSRRGQEQEMIPSAVNEGGTPTSVFRLGHRRWLDGLRGVAILLVMAFHLGLLPGGFLGVDFFFVLSGFLITSLLLQEWQSSGLIRLEQFYLRRALRLLPAFLLLLLLCGLSILWLPSARERWARCREIAVAACYVSNWPMLHQTYMRILDHSWSLSVEEQFYLLWPTLLYGMLRLRLSRRRVLLLVCCGIGASALLRMGLYHWYQSHGVDRGVAVTRLYRGLDTRADALLAGCLLGLIAAWDLLPKSQSFIRWTGAASLLCLVYLGYLVSRRPLEHSQFYHGLFTAVALMTALILARLLSAPAPFASRILESTPLVATGRISYALYLFHMPIIRLLLPPCVYLSLAVNSYLGHAVLIFLAVGLSYLAALLSYYLLERPCLRLKDRLRPRTTVNLLASSPGESPRSPDATHAAA
jgi:peptidoglycan/LPS O-acetylase OafA/YrhL